MVEIDPCIGMAAISKQGRDHGTVYVIINLPEKDFALVSDGNLRPLGKPKRKRIKHLKLTGVILADIQAMLLQTDKKKLYDTAIKRALKLFIDNGAGTEKKSGSAKK